MTERLFKSASEISTHFRCDNCGIQLDQITWMQCKLCKDFDLCPQCLKLDYDKLSDDTRTAHQKVHPNIQLTKDCMELVFVEEAEMGSDEGRKKRREMVFQRIINNNKIRNDYEMSSFMTKLSNNPSLLSTDNQTSSLIVNYFLNANERNIRVLSLDGGGVRGYMPIKILSEFIIEKNLPNIKNFNTNDLNHKNLFFEEQKKFTKQFDYFVGTSTGGLISFCLAVNYNILDMKEIYSNSKYYFKKNLLGPVIYSKYDPVRIHQKIDEIIDQIVLPDGKKLSSKHATLLDIRNYLNPDNPISEEKAKTLMNKHGNFLEFVDDDFFLTDKYTGSGFYPVRREKVLLITSYNTSDNIIAIFNTSYAKHWSYRIADILKSTMAAPTYFPPQPVYPGIQNNGYFLPGNKLELYIDGGVFANDPETAALWALRMQWKKPANYHLLCIGTGTYTTELSSTTWGGYFGWIFNNGFLVNTLMDATRSFTEVIGSNLAKFNNMRRMKLNYKITKESPLDDPNFPKNFDQAWEYLKDEHDFKALDYFYENYILEKH